MMNIPPDYRRLSDMSPSIGLSIDNSRLYRSKSECTSPCGSRCITPEPPTITLSDNFLHSAEFKRSRSASPDSSTFRSKLECLQIDVTKLGQNFNYHRSASHSSRDSLSGGGKSLSSNSFTRLSDPSDSAEPRRITVEFSDAGRGSRQSITSENEFADKWENPDHNFTSSLIMTSLQDGYFTAEISLQQIPMDNLVICINGHELEIMVDKNCTPKHSKKRKVSVPYHYGVVDLPIFVDTTSLVFAQDSDRNILIVQGHTKGSFSRRRSISYDMLPIQGKNSKDSPSAKWRRLLKKLGLRRTKSHGTIVAEWKTLVGSQKSPNQ